MIRPRKQGFRGHRRQNPVRGDPEDIPGKGAQDLRRVQSAERPLPGIKGKGGIMACGTFQADQFLPQGRKRSSRPGDTPAHTIPESGIAPPADHGHLREIAPSAGNPPSAQASFRGKHGRICSGARPFIPAAGMQGCT